MEFVSGQKVELKEIDLFIDVICVYPGAQGMRLNITGETFYGVTINGCKCYIGQNMLDIFTSNIQEKADKRAKAEKAEEPKVEVEKIKVKAKKK